MYWTLYYVWSVCGIIFTCTVYVYILLNHKLNCIYINFNALFELYSHNKAKENMVGNKRQKGGPLSETAFEPPADRQRTDEQNASWATGGSRHWTDNSATGGPPVGRWPSGPLTYCYLGGNSARIRMLLLWAARSPFHLSKSRSSNVRWEEKQLVKSRDSAFLKRPSGGRRCFGPGREKAAKCWNFQKNRHRPVTEGCGQKLGGSEKQVENHEGKVLGGEEGQREEWSSGENKLWILGGNGHDYGQSACGYRREWSHGWQRHR